MEEQEDMQIVPSTGISGDYINEICTLYNVIEFYKDESIDWFDKIIPLKRYEERYPPGEYPDLINDQNKESIKKINNLVDVINNMLSKQSRDFDKYHGLMKKIEFLVFGRNRVIK